MKNIIKKIALLAGIPICLFGLYVVVQILYGTITDYQPPASETIRVNNPVNSSINDSTFSLLIWNIGYGGLGADDDFFYDGGVTVRAAEDHVKTYLKGIKDVIKEHSEIDFILLQEVDTFSKRSYFKHEAKMISSILPEHSYSLGTNYNVKFIPIPFLDPMGKVLGGLVSYFRFMPSEIARISFPGNFPWPKRVFFLDRCFLLKRFSLPSGKQLVIINTHNSAYDDGTLKARQMSYLREILISEYENGNYVIVGGDWNQCPPNFDPFHFMKETQESYMQQNIDKDFLPPDWLWVYDPEVATNRKLATPYTPGKTFTTLIDFYLVSPNVKVIKVEGIDLQFQYSDHQPVKLEIQLM